MKLTMDAVVKGDLTSEIDNYDVRVEERLQGHGADEADME